MCNQMYDWSRKIVCVGCFKVVSLVSVCVLRVNFGGVKDGAIGARQRVIGKKVCLFLRKL